MNAFDAMCRAAEEIGVLEIVRAMRESHLFIPPGVFQPYHGDLEIPLNAIAPYPFPAISIIGSNGCIVIDRRGHRSPTVFDSSGTMLFHRSINDSWNMCQAFFVTTTSPHEDKEHHTSNRYHPIVFSLCDGINRWSAKSYIERIWSFNRKLDHSPVELEYRECSDDIRENIDSSVRSSLEAAFAAIFLVSQPSRFIVRMTPEYVRPSNSPKIPRQHERPVYTLLNKEEIKTRFLVPGHHHEHADPTPHWRRAHLRRLLHERYGEKRGTLVPVKSCWVGPDEFQQGRKTYKVLYDL